MYELKSDISYHVHELNRGTLSYARAEESVIPYHMYELKSVIPIPYHMHELKSEIPYHMHELKSVIPYHMYELKSEILYHNARAEVSDTLP